MAEVTEDNIGMRDEIMSTEHRPVHATLYECPTGTPEGCGPLVQQCMASDPGGEGDPALHVSFHSSWDQSPEHLRYSLTDRGFKHMPTVTGSRGYAEVRESSLAEGPHLWIEAEGQLTLDEVKEFRDQLDYLIMNHYQRDTDG